MSAARAKPRKHPQANAGVEADNTRRGSRARRRAQRPEPLRRAPRAQTPGRDLAAFRSFWPEPVLVATEQLPALPAQDWGQELEDLQYTIDAEEAYAAMRLASSRVEPVRARL